MALTIPEQIYELCKKSRHILITFRPDANGDALGSALAFSFFLDTLGKRSDIVSSGFTVPKSLSFLPKHDRVKNILPHLQKLQIAVDVHAHGLAELSYDVSNEKLHIFVTPKEGMLTKEHIETTQSEFLYDCIIVLDTPDLTSLGRLYTDNTSFFFATPVITIDHNPANEQFGHINLVDVTKSTTSEVVYSFLKATSQTSLTESTATSLLTGIIAKTRSFKSEDMKPQTLEIASELMTHGADRRHIVKELYNTRSVATLKLWGTILTHIKHTPELHLVASLLSRDAMERSGATEHDLEESIHELIATTPEAGIAVILYTKGHGADERIHGLLFTQKNISGDHLVTPFSPKTHNRITRFSLSDKTLDQAYETLRTHLSLEK